MTARRIPERLTRLLLVGVVLDLAIGIFLIYVSLHTQSVANGLAQTQTTQRQSCQAGNQLKAQVRSVWDDVLTTLDKEAPNPANAHRVLDPIKAKVDRAYHPLKCP
jgi:hypothetical protein